MRPNDLILRVLLEKKNGQWTAMCLDFTLAAQSDNLQEAKELLHGQIVDYLNEALVGQDKEHAFELLRRKAPWRYWAKYYFARFKNPPNAQRPTSRAVYEALPMRPNAMA